MSRREEQITINKNNKKQDCAEGGVFEPPVPLKSETAVFETAALVHYATPPSDNEEGSPLVGRPLLNFYVNYHSG